LEIIARSLDALAASTCQSSSILKVPDDTPKAEVRNIPIADAIDEGNGKIESAGVKVVHSAARERCVVAV
jgi:hypothetical protein